jgi:hypothetical protein
VEPFIRIRLAGWHAEFEQWHDQPTRLHSVHLRMQREAMLGAALKSAMTSGGYLRSAIGALFEDSPVAVI